MRTSEPIDGTAIGTTFIVTKEHRRFEEFCEACRRESVRRTSPGRDERRRAPTLNG